MITWTHVNFLGFLPINTVSLPDSPIATLGQGPLACSCDEPSLLQLHKRTQRAFNWLQCIPIGGGIWRSGKHRIGPCRRKLTLWSRWTRRRVQVRIIYVINHISSIIRSRNVIQISAESLDSCETVTRAQQPIWPLKAAWLYTVCCVGLVDLCVRQGNLGWQPSWSEMTNGHRKIPKDLPTKWKKHKPRVSHQFTSVRRERDRENG